MTTAPSGEETRWAAWCGWVLVGVSALSVLAGYLGPLAFAPVAALGGLLTLPALRVPSAHRWTAAGLLAVLIWAVGSVVWSPYQPKDLEGATAVKLLAQTPIYAALVCAAGLAAARPRQVALRILAWGVAGLGLVLTLEAMTGAAGYYALREAIGDPTRPDLAARNVAQGGFVLAILAPAATLAAWRVEARPWLAVPMVTGLVGLALAFGYDALLIALLAGVLAAAATVRWPKGAPRLMGAGVALYIAAAPAIVHAVRAGGWYAALESQVPLSWSMRMSYWCHAVDWIGDHPLRGWGLDASRMFSPGIELHPHNAALQIWLELGLVGALGAALFWGALLAGFAREKADAGTAAGAATACVYLVFSAVSFGVWQDWWLALGAVGAAVCLAVQRQPALARRKAAARQALRPSTPAVFSE
ncbi:MAG: O-antigen ligase family protein [Phenylobacterium sp.]|uniref:O-antigen ligase family protein n=1 Tax=Phenylobacterium sp. TaxID=1871053 RepID=UPI00391A6088